MSKPAPMHTKRVLRCAVYTRKSSEEGLEQAFNSLHAQREACEAFINSQRHQGWSALPQQYDDGGFSGATTNRPALQRLLAEIREGRVDVVVVYKIDRLTRSLADFAKIVEIFDAKGVSFVSVTQQFNTTSSMGRLTLNVLLSFAQFEREVTGERIRDKIAASKKKGMWMGGVPPLGYAIHERKLIIVEPEAETVRHIFCRYAALGSVRLLQAELEAAGIRSKRWTSASGLHWGGKPFARGALYLMLRNPIYRGKIVHKEAAYPGEHAPIIDEELWNAVQALLAANAVARDSGEKAKGASLLAGLLFDAEGQRLTPTHAVRRGKRYRYYVSRPLVTKCRADMPEGLRIPAGEIEQLVTAEIGNLLSDPARLFEALGPCIQTAQQQQRMLQRAGDLAAGWSDLLPAQCRPILVQIIRGIDVGTDRIDLRLMPARLTALLNGNRQEATSASPVGDADVIVLPVPAQLRRAGLGMALMIEAASGPGRAAKPDPKLIKLLARAHHFRDKLIHSRRAPLGVVARRETLTGSYFVRLVRLSYLAPDITQAILEGRHPRDLTAKVLLDCSRLPLTWPEQRRLLGFV